MTIGQATYTVEESARLLGVGRNQAYEAARNGEIAGVRVVRVGKRILVPKAPFDRMLAGESVPPIAAE